MHNNSHNDHTYSSLVKDFKEISMYIIILCFAVN